MRCLQNIQWVLSVVLQRNVLRIALHSLGSPLWLDEGSSGSPHSLPPPPSPTLPQFLHSLRGLLRRAYAVALVTVPTHLMQVQIVAQISAQLHKSLLYCIAGSFCVFTWFPSQYVKIFFYIIIQWTIHWRDFVSMTQSLLKSTCIPWLG